MLVKHPNPNVLVDRIIAELSSDQESYEYHLSELEKVSKLVLAEQGIPLWEVSVQTLIDDNRAFTERGIKAMNALISIRLIREWERDANEAGTDTAKRFYHVARHAMIASTASALISPMVSDFEAEKIKTEQRRIKGGEAKHQEFRLKEEIIQAELSRLWSEGERFSRLIMWSNAVVSARPELTPPDENGWRNLNRRISKIGKEAFGSEWPI